ncbi:MAG: deoxynucleoside kinase [Candidatus Eisenbacteria sp.]|nr:deoxynucleoside kinase [Candidatus Eisenbacteria bacterium]
MVDSVQRYTVIEGVIGVGKTTLARLMARKIHARLELEEVETNPFLKDFYEDQRRWAFQTQLFFLFSRFRQQRELAQVDLFQSYVVSDYFFSKDRIFAALNLSDDELALYDKIVELMEREIPPPDAIIYLQASTDVLMERIRKRDRPFERNITTDYIESLNEAYSHFFFHHRGSPVLVVSTDEIDFLRNESYVDDVLTELSRVRSGVRYYRPAGRE